MGQTLTSWDPATDEPVGEVPVASPADVTDALQRARRAQPAWARRSLDERMVVLRRFARRLLDAKDEVAELVTREAGKPVTEARLADVLPVLEMVRFLDRHGANVLSAQRLRLANPLLMGRTSHVEREPLGTVGIIAPWNYPLAIPGTQVLTALFAGNAVLLKPSEQTPLVAQRLAKLLDAAGLPEGLLQLVQGAGETGAALVEAGPDLVVFTGSVETGRTVAAHCARELTPHILELGGKDPMVVLEDANLEVAARGAVWGAFTNAGQTCAAVERLYVVEAVADQLLERIVAETERLRVGPGLAPDTDVGPLIDDAAVERCRGQLDQALEQGATLLTGGRVLEEVGPRFFAPTVLSGATHSMDVMRQETFGPLLPVQVVADQDEALERARDTSYGLSASVWTGDRDRGHALARQLPVGTVTVNDCVYTYAACETPWSGLKASGLGATHGRWGLEGMTRLKHVNHARHGRPASPWYYPYDGDLASLSREGLELLYGDRLEGLRAARPTLRRLRGA